MACFASVAAFQAKWGVGPSGLSGFAIFISVAGMVLSVLMLMIPVIYEKYDKLVRAARALKEVRVAFILTGIGVTFSLLIAFITTISAWTEPGCKNPANDPHASNGDAFQNELSGWCNTKKAGAVFFWLTFVFWTASLGLLFHYWRTGRLNVSRDPTFIPPQLNDEDETYDVESIHTSIPAPGQSLSGVPPIATNTAYDGSNNINSPFADPHRHSSAPSYISYPVTTPVAQPAGRPSLDAYGAFSDPAPSGFIDPSTQSNPGPPTLPLPDLGPRVSRTMQYADPYSAVRASLAGQGSPPSYESYSGYR
ncbi:hypothetical protein APHAL10511_004581 [Amanita phalloides]|nr:hypothetical protein APHAL10511_004581 [Amanita phalloides]